MDDQTAIFTKQEPAAAQADDAAGTTADSTNTKVPESHIANISIRGIITLTIVWAVCLLAFKEKEVKEPLYSMAFLALGYYFGQNKTTKTQGQ